MSVIAMRAVTPISVTPAGAPAGAPDSASGGAFGGSRVSRILPPLLILVVVLLLGACGSGGEYTQETGEPIESEGAPSETAEAPPEPAESGLPVATVGIEAGGETVEVRAEIAADDASRTRGLMEREELAEEAGMLFVFEDEGPRSFWMQNTLIPLSIAYIDSSGEIVDLQDLEPLDETSRPSAEPAQYALEVNQGFFAERGVQVGDTVSIPEEYS